MISPAKTDLKMKCVTKVNHPQLYHRSGKLLMLQQHLIGRSIRIPDWVGLD